MASAFLLPKRKEDDGDEVTSPIWISSHGLDVQIGATGSGVLTIRPKLSVYVRVFPNEEDLKRPDCRLRRPPLHKIKQQELAAKRDAAVAARAAKENVKPGSPQWKKLKTEEYAKVCEAEGIPANHDWLTDEAAPLPLAEGEAEVPGETDIGEALPTNAPLVVVKIDPSKDDFYGVVEAPQKWLRLQMEPPALTLDPYASPDAIAQAVATHNAQMDAYIQERIQTWLNDPSPDTGGKLWVFRKGETIKASECANWSNYLADMRARNNGPEIPEIVVRWDIEVGKDYADPTRTNLHIALENHSKPLQRGAEKRREHAIFQIIVETDLPRSMHRELRLDRIEPSYRYNQYLNYPAIGYNGGVEDGHSTHDTVKLRTTWAPRFVQPRVRPVDYPGVVRRMRDLAEAKDSSGLTALVTAYRAWIDTEPTRTNPTAGAQSTEEAQREKQKFDEHRKQWAAEADAIEAGIAILEESRKHWKEPGAQADPLAIPFEAWRATNETMANLMLRRFGEDKGMWHLFQLAFVLATLPSVVTRMPEWKHRYDEKRDDSVTLLYFSTGGGKSEAFFGLLAFTLFLDRLRGKHFGVTALVRYPLRLLTVNQAQRMAAMMAQAELVRRKYNYPGVVFAIGFWVGSSGTPNHHSDDGVRDIPRVADVTIGETEFADKNPDYAAARKAWQKLPTCPFCGTTTGLRRLTTGQGGTIAHICRNGSCPSHHDGKNLALPFYICDDDIYALAPSVILGTVDKLAMIGHSAGTLRKVLGMFGTAPWRDQATGRLEYPQQKQLAEGPEPANAIALHPVYEQGLKLFHDPAPALIVQDEAHLLEESLGSFAGLFESALDALFADLATVQRNICATDPTGSRRRAKVIAASATVADPQRQLEHLYQRHIPATQFPFPGPTLYRSFYAAPQEPAEPERAKIEEVEMRARTGRFYRAIMTNGRPHTATSVAILAAFHATITRLTAETTTDDPDQQAKARELLVAHLSSGVTEPFLRAALTGPTLLEVNPQIATLIDLHRIGLTYVTNKKGGDQIQAAEAEETRKRHILLQLPFEHLEAALITGSVDQGQIDETVKRTRQRSEVGKPFENLAKLLRSVVATSAISHGVDIEELNSMFFAGLPSDVAEYIQASSRIGRTHVGFSLLIPTPQRRRDRYVIEVFDIFHRFLERMVQPAAIDRWAERAVERVLSSFFQSAVCGAMSISALISLPDDKKGSWKPLDYASNLLALYNKDKIAFEARVCSFIELAVGLKDGFATDGKSHYQRMIKERVRNIMTELGSGPYKNTSLREYFNDMSIGVMHRPMTSLRDVDEGGTIRKGPYDDNPKGKGFLHDKQVIEVMQAIRRGTAVGGETE
jgi:hypothetical protein